MLHIRIKKGKIGKGLIYTSSTLAIVAKYLACESRIVGIAAHPGALHMERHWLHSPEIVRVVVAGLCNLAVQLYP
jgi:hypothetical protein